MHRRGAHIIIGVLFSLLVGYASWATFVREGPPDYVEGGLVKTLHAPEPRARNFYLRRDLYLPDKPELAWVRLLSFDLLEFYVNGKLAIRQDPKDLIGFPLGVVTDITPLLRPGRNVLAAVCRQQSLTNLPEISVEGAYRIGQVEFALDTSGPWKCNSYADRTYDYWLAPDFDDRHWPDAVHAENTIIASVKMPRRAYSEPDLGRWIMPDQPGVEEYAVRYDFEVPEEVDYAWMRQVCTAAHRMAINSGVVNLVEAPLEDARLANSPIRIFDITRQLRRGHNSLCFWVSSKLAAGHLNVDFEVAGRSGRLYRFSSDETWQWAPTASLPVGGWLADARPDANWQPCATATATIGGPLHGRQRMESALTPPPGLRMARLTGQLGMMLIAALVAFGGATLVDRLIRRGVGAGRRYISPAYLALVPALLVVVVAMLAVFDPRITRQMIYQPWLVVLTLAVLLAQWLVQIVLLSRPPRAPLPAAATRGLLDRPAAVWAAMVLILAVGAYLRIKDMSVEPLTPDEVSMHRATMGIYQRGFPSIEIHPDIPPVYASTSELVYWGIFVSSWIFPDNERLMVRAPSVVWGVVTTWLMFITGRRMFRPWVGVVAALAYAISAYCIGMSTLGRYYSQLQAFTVLTVYFFYRTLEGDGPLDRKSLWFCVLSFLGMMLSWEGSALVAPALVAGALILRRERVRTLFCEPHVWAGFGLIALIIVAQQGHRAVMQTGRPLYGSGASDVALTPMWRYPTFDLWYYFLASSWNRDTLLPLLGFGAGTLLVVRHAFHRGARLCMAVLIGGTVLLALLLPVTGKRYGYHTLPFWLLLSAAALIALGHVLSNVAGSQSRPWLRSYGRGVTALVCLAYALVGSGLALDIPELRFPRSRVAGKSIDAMRTPWAEQCVEWVKERMEPGDVVIATAPHVINQYLGRPSDYWLQTQMRLQATLDDKRTIPLHRLAGTVMLPDIEHLQDIFARYPRVWLIGDPRFNYVTNQQAALTYLRQNMDIVYEDFSTTVLFRGDDHLPVELQLKSEETRTRAGIRE